MTKGEVLGSLLAALVLTFAAGSTALADVTTTGSTWDDGSYFYVGYSDSSTGTLTIDGSSVLSRTRGYLGYASASTGTATVTGTGSTWTNSLTFSIGHDGSGMLNIEAGGQVSTNYAYLGYQDGSTGTVTVTGTGSTWTNSGYLGVGGPGTGTLNIEAGGQLSGNYSCINGFGSTSRATVTGTGSKWTNSSNLYVAEIGSGTLNIQGGGQVSNTTGYIGYYSGSTGAATVTGNGSTWTNSGDLYVCYGGSGTLTVADGGSVSARTLFASPSDLFGDGTISATQGAVLDAQLVFDGTHELTQTLPFGIGGTLSLNVDPSGTLGAGYKGTGTLRIADGVTVASSDGYLGYNSGSTGTATVTGTGSKWTNSDKLYVGLSGSGTLNIEAGGQVIGQSQGYIYFAHDAYLGYNSGSTGTATVTGSGSKWINSNLYVGYDGSGTLNIKAGGQVLSSWGYIGGNGAGTVTVTGAGSKWIIIKNLDVGHYAVSATLTVANGGLVTARSMGVDSQSAVNLHVSGNGMIMLGNFETTGSLWNNGKVNFYADSFLAAGVYSPITEFAGRTIDWTGSGSYYAFGGTWNAADKTFNVADLTLLTSGDAYPVSTGERVLITDPESGRKVGATFGSVTGSPTFAAAPMGQGALGALAVTEGFDGVVLSAWDFSTTLAGGTEVFLSFDIGPGVQDPQIWHYDAGTWTPFDSGLVTYDSASGILSLTVNGFSGYALTGTPEPATLSLLVLGALAMLRRRKHNGAGTTAPGLRRK